MVTLADLSGGLLRPAKKWMYLFFLRTNELGRRAGRIRVQAGRLRFQRMDSPQNYSHLR